MKRSSKFWLPLVLVPLLSSASADFALGQIIQSERSSSSSTSGGDEVKGYAFKYKQRFENYSSQIDMGVSKGWLTAEQAETFRTRLNELRSVESAAAHNGYPEADIANLDKMTTKFNEDLSSSSTPKASTPAPAQETKSEASASEVVSKPKAAVTKKVTTKKTARKKTSTTTTTQRSVSK